MMATLLSTTLLAAALIVPAVNAIHLNLPDSIAVGDKVTIDAGGEGTLNVAVLHADSPCGDAIKEWLKVDPADLHWTVDAKPGDQVVFLVEENNSDAEKWSKTFTVAAAATSSTGAASGTTASIPPPSDAGFLPSSSSASDDADATGGPDGAINAGNAPDQPSGASARAAVSVGALAIAALFAAML